MDSQGPSDSERQDKGKGKSTEDKAADGNATSSEDCRPAEDGHSSTIFSRIARSAVGLSRDLVTARPSGSDLAAFAATTDKAGPSAFVHPPGSTPGEGSASTRPQGASSAAAGSFASGHVQQHVSAQEEDFARFLGGTNVDMSMPSEPIIGLDDGSSVGPAASTTFTGQDGPLLRTLSASDATRWHDQPSAVAEQERRDGKDVVNLLAAVGQEPEPDYDKDIELAEDEIAALRQGLFGMDDTPHIGVSNVSAQEWDNVLNFIPDFVRPSSDDYEREGAAPLASPSAASKSQESRAFLGVPHTAEATRLWLDQWQDVLTRYDDEVWGGLSPLVSQARQEVDQLQQSEQDPAASSTKALNRLRQILGHLRGQT